MRRLRLELLNSARLALEAMHFHTSVPRTITRSAQSAMRKRDHLLCL